MGVVGSFWEAFINLKSFGARLKNKDPIKGPLTLECFSIDYYNNRPKLCMSAWFARKT